MEHREDVRTEDELDLLGGNVEKRAVSHLIAGVVDEHVDRAEFLDRAIDQRKAVITIADVARTRDAASSRVLDQSLGLRRVVVFIEVGAQHVGALTRHVTIQNSSVVRYKLPLLAEVAGEVGDNQVRNMGTMGGVIAHADAAGDYPTLALMLDAEIVTNERTIAAKDFFKDLFTTALTPDEIVTEVVFPVAGGPHKYMKFRRRLFDWDGVLGRYRPVLDRLATHDDLVDLLWEVHGELGTSHAYVSGSGGWGGSGSRQGQ